MLKLPEYDEVKAGGEKGLEPGQTVHLPSPSFYPIIAAACLFLAAYGIVYGRSAGANYLLTGLGLGLLVATIAAWGLEPSTEPEDSLEDPEADELLGLGAPADETLALPSGETAE
jgi:hypothetical protein